MFLHHAAGYQACCKRLVVADYTKPRFQIIGFSDCRHAVEKPISLTGVTSRGY